MASSSIRFDPRPRCPDPSHQRDENGEVIRARVKIRKAHRAQSIKESWETIKTKNCPERLFVRDGVVVRLKRLNGQIVAEPLTKDAMTGELDRHIQYMEEKKEGLLPAATPPAYAGLMLHDPVERIPLPELEWISRVPIFNKEGTLVASPGYDSPSKVYLDTEYLEVPPIPKTPEATDIQEAKQWLQFELLGDFEFGGVADRAAAIALVLSPFTRKLITGPYPLILLEKPEHGVGASLLAEVALYPGLGKFPAMTTLSKLEDQFRWELIAWLIQGKQAIVLDNLETVDNQSLASVLTSEYFTARPVGSGRVPECPNLVTWVGTGVRPRLHKEIVRRTVPIWLNKNSRTEFRYPELKHSVTEMQGDLVWAALLLIQNWVVRGRPLAKTRLPSYEHYSGVMGGILEAADIDGFLTNRPAFVARHIDAADLPLEELVKVWWEQFKTQNVLPSELVSTFPSEINNLGLASYKGNTLAQSLGYLLSENTGKLLGKFRLDKAPHQKGYRLVLTN